MGHSILGKYHDVPKLDACDVIVGMLIARMGFSIPLKLAREIAQMLQHVIPETSSIAFQMIESQKMAL
jgi:hypothetical protein